MPQIPLPHFPPEFRPVCFKCSSTNLNFTFTRHPWLWNETEIKCSCGKCGALVYGDTAVTAKFADQLKSWKAEQARIREEAERMAAEERRRAEEAEAARRVALGAAEIRRKAEERALMVAAALERRKQETVERRRARDRERKALLRAAAKAASGFVEETSEEAEARKLAALERKRKIDKEYRIRKRSAARAVKEEVKQKEEEVQRETRLPDEERCAWHKCENPRAPRSKYCCRTCSNRNASLNARKRAVEARLTS